MCVCVCVCVCMYVCMYVCTVISPKAGWILTQCWHRMRIPTHPCTCKHTLINTHTAHPHTTTARRTKPGVEWGRVVFDFLNTDFEIEKIIYEPRERTDVMLKRNVIL
jgi:hypothetical protein